MQETYSPIETKSLFTHWLECYTRHFFDFRGRARRREYWGFVLFDSLIPGLICLGLSFSDSFTLVVLSYVIQVITVLPSLAVTVRRLHDTGRSGAYILIGLIPLIGGLVLLWWLCQDSKYETNEWGECPKPLPY